MIRDQLCDACLTALRVCPFGFVFWAVLIATTQGQEALYLQNPDKLASPSNRPGQSVFLSLSGELHFNYKVTGDDESSESQSWKQYLSVDPSSPTTLTVECPAEINRLADTWVQRVKQSHDAAIARHDPIYLMPFDIDKLRGNLGFKAITKTIFDLADAPQLIFHVYGGGKLAENSSADDMRVVLERLVIHCSPTPAALVDIRKKFALPAVIVEATGVTKTDFFALNAVGSDKFKSDFQKTNDEISPTASEYLESICTKPLDSIPQLNSDTYRKWIQFANRMRGTALKLGTDEAKNQIKNLSESPSDALKADRALANVLDPKMRLTIQRIYGGTSNPMLELVFAGDVFRMIDGQVSEEVKKWYREEVLGANVFLAVDLEGVWLIDGQVAMSSLERLVKCVGTNTKAKKPMSTSTKSKRGRSPDDSPMMAPVDMNFSFYAHGGAMLPIEQAVDSQSAPDAMAIIDDLYQSYQTVVPLPDPIALPSKPVNPFFTMVPPTRRSAADQCIKICILLLKDAYQIEEQFILEEHIRAFNAIGDGGPYNSIPVENLVFARKEIEKRLETEQIRYFAAKQRFEASNYRDSPEWARYTQSLQVWEESCQKIRADYESEAAALKAAWPEKQKLILSKLDSMRKRQSIIQIKREAAKKNFDTHDGDNLDEAYKQPSRTGFVILPSVRSLASEP